VDDEPYVVFGIDLRKWAEGGWTGQEREMLVLTETISSGLFIQFFYIMGYAHHVASTNAGFFGPCTCLTQLSASTFLGGSRFSLASHVNRTTFLCHFH
jgi:hypothetical protein